MLMDAQTADAGPAGQLLGREAAGRNPFEWAGDFATSHPASPAASRATDRVVLRRGAEMMVLFRGCPCPTEVGALRQARVKLGLALSSGELPAVRGFDDYSYVFVGVRRRARSTLAEAVADLEGDSWSIDDESA